MEVAMRMGNTVRTAAVLMSTLTGLLVLPATPAEVQSSERRPPVRVPVVVDADGRVLGQLMSVHGIGVKSGPSIAVVRQGDIGVVAIEVNGRIVHVGVAQDRFVGSSRPTPGATRPASRSTP